MNVDAFSNIFFKIIVWFLWCLCCKRHKKMNDDGFISKALDCVSHNLVFNVSDFVCFVYSSTSNSMTLYPEI